VIDAAGAMLCILAALLSAVAIVFSHRFCANAGGMYHALILATLGGMCGFAETGNLANLVLFYALMCAAAFPLCRHDPESSVIPQGARAFGIAATAGGSLLLLAVALLFGHTGTFGMAEAGRALAGHPDPIVIAALVLFVGGCFVLAAVVPFHFWIADTHAFASAPICLLLSGILVELGLYGVARVYWVVFSGAMEPSQNDVRNILAAFGTVTALAGAVLAYRQRHLKKMLALSTVSQVGLVLMAISLLTPQGLGGAGIYVMGHAFLKGALFLASGIVLHRFGSVDEMHLHGRGRHLRWTGAIFFICAAGIAGLPPFGAFWGNVMVDGSAYASGYGWMSWVAGIAAAISAGAVFRFAGRVFFGWGCEDEEPAPSARSRAHTPMALYASTTVLLLFGLLAGLAPRLTGAAYESAVHIQDRTGYTQRVLDLMTPYPSTVHELPAGSGDIGRAVASLLGGLLLAGWSLRRSRPFVTTHTADPSSVR
jgi:multicomponent Na+:H+ antiporter subunit D